MPLTRTQLEGLPAPAGWVWHTRPTLRTRGYVLLDEAQGLSRSNASARINALREWAQANDLGVTVVPLDEARTKIARRAYTLITSNYYDVPFPKLFKVVANQPAKSEPTFGEYTCLCGLKIITPDNAACENCGTHKCAQCGAGYVKLFKINSVGGQYMYCGACTKECAQCSRNRIRSNELCRECNPHKSCIICMMPFPVADVTELTFAEVGPFQRRLESSSATAHICKRCRSQYHCSKCNTYDWTGGRSNGLCPTCAAKELDKIRAPLEKLPSDWIPAGGSLLVPSADYRPFRTISIEMELDGDGPLTAQTLYACGLVPIPTVASYSHHPDTKLEYPCFLKHDGTVTAGELIAYLLNLDDPAHADVLMDVCKKVHSLVQLKKLAHGPTAGGHIHVDAHNFSYGDVWRLVIGEGYVEDPLYRIAGAGSAYGHRSLDPAARRMRAGGYAAVPVKGPFGTKGTLGNSIQAQGKHHGLNFTPYLSSAQLCECGSMAYDDAKNCKCNLGKSTIEWRLFNSTHNPRILHAWIALVQAFMAWSTGDGDPTAEWEAQYPPLQWTNLPWKDTSAKHKDLAAERIEWMFLHLPLTENERDSIAYAVEQSDIDLGKEFPEHLRSLLPLNEFEVKKAARNPARRQRAIRVGTPTPGAPAYTPQSAPRLRVRSSRIFQEELSRNRQRMTANFSAPPQPGAPTFVIEEDD